MRAIECERSARAAGSDYQRVVNAFIDDFRRASAEEKARLVAEPIGQSGTIRGARVGCRERSLSGVRHRGARVGRMDWEPGAILCLPREELRAARPADGGVARAVPGEERVRAGELLVARVTARAWPPIPSAARFLRQAPVHPRTPAPRASRQCPWRVTLAYPSPRGSLCTSTASPTIFTIQYSATPAAA